MSDSSVSISFRYSEIDYIRAMRAHYAERLRIWLDIIVVIVGGAAAAYLWQWPDSRWLSIVLFSVIAIFALLLISAFTLLPKMIFRREPKLRDEYNLTFSHEGIHLVPRTLTLSSNGVFILTHLSILNPIFSITARGRSR